ncbi:hypothetical protein KQX54_021410 [Cotesia glomerata]|uniref:Uncharacterized protein n=1 Tax=Cotesia glomerata TaxID=32391 RepID=A0AAV7J6N4_COTGL|nr:hypothetical protein KQX54_021410 [Cotesia glomerata]
MAGPPARRECNNDVACECCVSGMTDAWTGGKRVGFFTRARVWSMRLRIPHVEYRGLKMTENWLLFAAASSPQSFSWQHARPVVLRVEKTRDTFIPSRIFNGHVGIYIFYHTWDIIWDAVSS